MLRIFLPFLAFLFACQSQPDQKNSSLQEFRKVEESLRQSAAEAREREKQYDAEPPSEFLQAALLLNRVKLLVRSADSTGERRDIGDSLVIDTPTGTDLYTIMQAVYRRSSNEKFRQELQFSRDEWLRRYFHWVPSMAIQTILSKMSHDVEAIAASSPNT